MKRMLGFVTPVWLAMMVNSLQGITDFTFLNTISNDYLTVVGVAYIPFTLIISLIIGLGIESNRNQANNSPLNFWYITSFALASAFILVLIAQLFADLFLFFALESPLYPQIKTYFQIICFSIIPTSLLFICTGILRGNGLTKKTLKFSIMAVVFNLIFDYLFITVNLFGNPLLGCGIATVLADSLVALIYILYFMKNKLIQVEHMNILKFINNATTNSLEKLLSSSTLQLISSIFIVKLSVSSATIFFVLERYFAPLLLFSHGYFEWIVYSRSKGIKSKITIYPLYFLLLLIYGSIIVKILDFNQLGINYAFVYIIYLTSFLLERSVVANFFASEMGKIVNYVVFAKNLIFVLSLFLLTFIDKLTLLSFGYANLIFTLIEVIILSAILRYGEASEYKKAS
ncbi:MATE family efflux transporter [Alteribacillus sp. JSM 102045]|uniref:MATE family efflux transporter n=1 Tax=Alteribacillus sp. JSM 102045 TaxID=1562101 RepID=UPI0035BFC4D5